MAEMRQWSIHISVMRSHLGHLLYYHVLVITVPYLRGRPGDPKPIMVKKLVRNNIIMRCFSLARSIQKSTDLGDLVQKIAASQKLAPIGLKVLLRVAITAMMKRRYEPRGSEEPAENVLPSVAGMRGGDHHKQSPSRNGLFSSRLYQKRSARPILIKNAPGIISNNLQQATAQ